MEDFVIVPSRDAEYVSLARTKTGTLFRKHILSYGDLIHPATGQKIKIDDAFVSKMQENFNNNVCDIVQVPLANDSNQHSEDPTRNIGEVVDIEVKGEKVYAVIDVRDPAAAEKVKNKTILGVSAMLHLNYTDTRTGKKVGPTLLHACATNRPYVVGLEDYEEIVKASAENSKGTLVLEEINADKTEEAVLQTEPADLDKSEDKSDKNSGQSEPELEEKDMTKEELVEALKEHGIDVADLQAQANKASDATELSNALVSALTDSLKLSNGENADPAEVVGAVVELAHENAAMHDRLENLELTNAKSVVDEKVRTGYLLPRQRDLAVKLYLSNRDDYNMLVAEKPFVAMDKEAGSPDNPEKVEFDVDEAVAKFSNMDVA